MSTLLKADFGQAELHPGLRWINPPSRWRLQTDRRCLVVEPDAPTDFWQGTHYGFRVDSGHFLGMELADNFAVSARIGVSPVHQYDQAGLMVRLDATSWVKTSVEHELEGEPQLGVVVTSHGFSDWSLQDAPGPGKDIWLRLSKRGADLTAEFKYLEEAPWKLMRVAHWHGPEGPLLAGVYACSPKGEGFSAEFGSLLIERLV